MFSRRREEAGQIIGGRNHKWRALLETFEAKHVETCRHCRNIRPEFEMSNFWFELPILDEQFDGSKFRGKQAKV